MKFKGTLSCQGLRRLEKGMHGPGGTSGKCYSFMAVTYAEAVLAQSSCLAWKSTAKAARSCCTQTMCTSFSKRRTQMACRSPSDGQGWA